MKRNRILTGTYVKETPRFLPQSCDFLLVKNFQNFREEERNLVCIRELNTGEESRIELHSAM